MIAGDAAIALLREFEGFSPIPYEDIAGIWTIGIGHRIMPGEHYTTLTQDQAVELLLEDLKWRQDAVSQCLGDCKVNQNQFDALVCFVYNLGGKSLLDSTLLKDIKLGNFANGANEFMRWNKARVKGILVEVPGLTRRREAERKLFMAKDVA